MNYSDAKRLVERKFPFPGYMGSAVDSYSIISETVHRYLRGGDSILDYGSGPCDKTAVLQAQGYLCSACDDLSDAWHRETDNIQKVAEFAREMKIDFHLTCNGDLPFDRESFDMVMMHDVLEHLHDSPRELLNDLLELVRPNGFLFITVPNAANIRKRLSLAVGRTNYTRYDKYYWYPGPWRGHVREYVKHDLILLAEYLGLELRELRSCHNMTARLPWLVRMLYVGITNFFPGWRDTWLMVAQKPSSWRPKRTLDEDAYRSIIGSMSPYGKGQGQK